MEVVTKADAMRRQLDAAIKLWFDDGDAVAIHTLASASHEILHTLFKRRGFKGLLFDSPIIKKENQQRWASELKEHANFFKHARGDIEGKIRFNPRSNDLLLAFMIYGLTLMDEPLNIEELAFMNWIVINRPDVLIEGAYDISGGT